MFPLCCKITIIIIIISLLFSTCTGGDFGKFRWNGECLRPDGGRGVCKIITECEPLLNLLIKGKPRPQPWIIDFLRRSHCGFEGKDPVVCCPVMVKSKDDRTNLNAMVKDQVYEKFLNKSCGAVQTLDKVIGGSETASHEFPWMALILYKTRFGLNFRCGGSLINSRYVLTAAHCVMPSTDIYPVSVRLGEHDLESSKGCDNEKACNSYVEDIDIEELIPHPNYLKTKLRNDIALIRLAKNVQFKPYIRPICLPVYQDLSERCQPDDRGIVAGWGTTELGVSTPVLKKVTLPIIPLDECSKIYRNKIPITDSQICAGGEAGKDSCRGDSGGPLQMIGTNPSGEPAYIQEGIVSFGPRLCGMKGMPGVYTRVAYYVDWIFNTVKD